MTGNNIKGVGIITAASVVADLTGVVTGNVVGNATGLTGIPDINVRNVNIVHCLNLYEKLCVTF